jgi:SWI/SNF-related matrix-associated actin-dependent regulator 1 of chromatin subfamily A
MRKLMPHQEEGLAFLETTGGRALIADTMGLGKSMLAATYAHKCFKLPLLILCPASLKDNWIREIEMVFGTRQFYKVEGKVPKAIPRNAEVVIANYDILPFQVHEIVKHRFDVAIIDECHVLANRNGPRTKAAKLLSRRIRHIIGLSGTPIRNRPADFWAILNIIRPQDYRSFQEYAWKYCEPSRNYFSGKWEYKGATNMDALYTSIQPFTLRRDDTVLKLPPKTLHIHPLECDLTEYREAEADFLAWLTKTKRYGKLEKAKKAEAISRMSALLNLAGKAKTIPLIRWAQGVLADPDQKLVIFCNHLKMQAALMRQILPGGSVCINGGVAPRKRQAIVDKFQNDPQCRLLVGGIKAAGVGLTLTAATKLAIAELPWTPTDIDQALKRIHRIGQDKPCEFYFAIAMDTLDEWLCELIQEKRTASDAAIDNKKQTDMPLADMLMSRMGKKK